MQMKNEKDAQGKVCAPLSQHHCVFTNRKLSKPFPLGFCGGLITEAQLITSLTIDD